MRSPMPEKYRPYAITIGASSVGFLIAYLLDFVLGIDLSKISTSLLNLLVTSFFAFHFLPKIRGIPFGKVDTRVFLHRLGIYLPDNAFKHVLLGLTLAALTLSGMYVGSTLSGLYVFDPGTIDLSQIIFSINPGLWEELFYRGVMMALLLHDTKSVKQSAIIQVILFSLFHLKGFEFWSLVDMFSVSLLAVSFTYAAYKTRTLMPGILFHFLHDSFVFVVQVPSSVPLNDSQNAVFFVSLWVAVGIGVLVTKISAENLGVQAKEELYKIGK